MLNFLSPCLYCATSLIVTNKERVMIIDCKTECILQILLPLLP